MPKRTHEHVNGIDPKLMSELARKGADMYHPPGQLPELRTRPLLNPDQQRSVGQMSLTDGVYIPREAPDVESSGLGWPASHLNPECPESTGGIGWPE